MLQLDVDEIVWIFIQEGSTFALAHLNMMGRTTG
jgi:hypothetical protein